MELDELKNTWMVLDEQLKKNELLNKRLVQEMLSNKSNRSLNKIINTELIGIIILLLVSPIWIWLLNYRPYESFLFTKILSITGIVVTIFGIIWGIYTLKKYLLKIDFSNCIKENLQYVNKYDIYYRKGKMLNYYIIIPVLFLLGILVYYELKANLFLWVFLVVAYIIGIVITYWMYKKVYDSNIQSIQKSLEELEELKEE
jgi:hypothetical protein